MAKLESGLGSLPSVWGLYGTGGPAQWDGAAEAKRSHPGIQPLSFSSMVTGVSTRLYSPSPRSGVWIIYQVAV